MRLALAWMYNMIYQPAFNTSPTFTLDMTNPDLSAPKIKYCTIAYPEILIAKMVIMNQSVFFNDNPSFQFKIFKIITIFYLLSELFDDIHQRYFQVRLKVDNE